MYMSQHYKWCNAKVILGCAFFHDLLQPVAHLSKVLQQVSFVLWELLKIPQKSLDNLKSTPFEELPSVKKKFFR